MMLSQSKMYLAIKDPTRIKGDVGLSKRMLTILHEKEGFWAICPMSRAMLHLKEHAGFYYIVEDTGGGRKSVVANILEEMAIDIAENMATKGRIHIKRAEEVMGAIRVDVEFGIPNLLWALYPRGIYGILKAPILLKALSVLTKPLFFLFDKSIRAWQHRVYRRVYNYAFTTYPQFSKELYSGLQHPERL